MVLNWHMLLLLFKPFECIKFFLIYCTVGLICGFHLLVWFFFKFVWPGVPLLNLAKKMLACILCLI